MFLVTTEKPRRMGEGNTQEPCLLVAVGPLLLRGRARLRRSVAPVLLSLSLLVAGVLRGRSLRWTGDTRGREAGPPAPCALEVSGTLAPTQRALSRAELAAAAVQHDPGCPPTAPPDGPPSRTPAPASWERLASLRWSPYTCVLNSMATGGHARETAPLPGEAKPQAEAPSGRAAAENAVCQRRLCGLGHPNP